MKCNCKNCKYLFVDESVNDFECMNNQINEEELQIYFTEGKENCKHFKEKMQEKDDFYFFYRMN